MKLLKDSAIEVRARITTHVLWDTNNHVKRFW